MKLQTQPKFVIGIMGKAGSGKDTVANMIIRGIGYAKKYSFADSLKQMCSEVFDIPIEWMYDQDLKKQEVIINLNNPYTINNMEKWVYDNIYKSEKWRWVIAKPELSGVGDGMRYQHVTEKLLNILEHEIINRKVESVEAYTESGMLVENHYKISVRLLLQLMGTEVIRNTIGDTFWAEIKEEIDTDCVYIIPDCRFESEVDYVTNFDNKMIIVVDNKDLDSSSTDGHDSEKYVDTIGHYGENIGKNVHFVRLSNNLSGDYEYLANQIEKMVISHIEYIPNIKITEKWI